MEEIYDLTNIAKEKVQEWILVFTKENPDERFTHVWVNDHLLFMDVKKAEDFRWYWGAFTFEFKDGLVMPLLGSSMNREEAKAQEKERLKEGEFFKAITLRKRIRFDPTPVSSLKILMAEPITAERKQSLRTRLSREINTKLDEIKSLQSVMLQL